MAAKVWAWLSEKGGVGKTTNVINVGCQLKAQGHNVLIVDADPHKSSSSWSALAGENAPAVVIVEDNLKNDVAKLRQAFDYILIDCEGRLGDRTLDSMKVSDLVVIPYAPSPLDVWGNDSLVELIQARQEVTEGKPAAVMLVNIADKRTTLSRTIKGTLEGYNLPVLESNTSRLTDYIETLIEGNSVVNLGQDNKAAFEIRKLTKELQGVSNG
jgi:chromosome partitioning protein